ncbi:MAG: hypothetical protein QNJ11_05860 [Woeseiaceae bacterium]|nr:hypothetical protein [Woeseiaceae bacterium]
MANRAFLYGAAWLLLPLMATAEVTIQAHAFTEVVDRGRSLTDGGAAVGASFSYDGAAGWFAGAGGFYSDDSPWGAPKTRNVNGFVGWFRELDGDRAIELSLVRNRFLDVDGWDYTEVQGSYHLNPELSLSLAWSPDYYGRDADSVIFAGNWQPELSPAAYLVFSGGAGYLSGIRDTAIYYAEAGIGYRAGRFDISATLSAVDSDSERIFVTDGSTLAVRLSYLVL